MLQYLHWGSVSCNGTLPGSGYTRVIPCGVRRFSPQSKMFEYILKGSMNMTIGPLEFVVIGCKGDRFTSEIVPELNSIQEKGLIRVVDLIFVRKDADGTVKALEVHDLNDDERASFDPIREDLMRILTPQDIALLTEAIPPDTSAV